MKKLISVFSLVFLLSGCASTTQYVKAPSDNSTGKNMNNESVAQIYVLRPSSYGSAITYKIYQGETFIGELGPNSYLTWVVDLSEGEVSIISKAENYDMLKLVPKAGSTYYIKQKVKMGWITARTKLEWMNEKEALDVLKKLKKPKSIKTIQ